MDRYSRYYTEQVVSTLLMGLFRNDDPSIILDLGIGQGALTKVAHQRWKNAQFYGLDIDAKQFSALKTELPYVFINRGDGVKSRLQSLQLKYESVDVAICNPPYVKIKQHKKYNKLFQRAGIEECQLLSYLTSDLVFLAHNLCLLRDGGELGIILPDGLLTGLEFKSFRNALIRSHSIRSIIQLPDNIFQRTEARTYILIIDKVVPSASNAVKIFRADETGKCIDVVEVPQSALSDRMDFHYNKWKMKRAIPSLTLSDIGASICRGAHSFKHLRESNTAHFHTNCFKEKAAFHFRNRYEVKSSSSIAKAGDILLARVGKRSIGKVGYVKSGRVVLSDCVFKITVPARYFEMTFKAFRSLEGQEWIKVHAHGVCSQVLNKSDLINFPIQYSLKDAEENIH